MRGLFVTGTDTGVGKSVASACLLASMRAAGESVRAYKPVLTGIDEPLTGPWPADHELLAVAAGMEPNEVAPLRFGPAASPHLAAALAGVELDRRGLIARAHELGDGHTLVVEGVGGLLVPLTGSFSVCDLAAALSLGVVVVARRGLGTINHTLLTLEAARRAGLEVLGVLLSELARRALADGAVQPRDDRRPGGGRGPHPSPPAGPRSSSAGRGRGYAAVAGLAVTRRRCAPAAISAARPAGRP